MIFILNGYNSTPCFNKNDGSIAQSVEQVTENHRVAGSIPARATTFQSTFFIKIVTIFLLFLGSDIFAASVTLAKVYTDSLRIEGWLMSEKLDGVRGVWDGERLLTKNGQEIHAPKDLLAQMPPFPVDGELWTKRGDFEHITSIVLDTAPSAEWGEVTYNIFEAPFANLPFQARIEKVRQWLQAHPSTFIKVIPQQVCTDKAELKRFLETIEKGGGEGVVLRNPDALYESGRSDSFLKVKSFLDAEARIVGYKEGKGKYKGMTGSLEVELENGKRFFIGSGLSDEERSNPPKIGAVITFKYKELNKNGIPKFASYLRERRDYVWGGDK